VPAAARALSTMRGTLGRRCRTPDEIDKSAKRAKKKKTGASFGKLPQDLQKTILQMFYQEEGIDLREQIKRLGTVRLICRCTNEWARLALTAHAVERENERRKELKERMDDTTFAAVAKAILAKDVGMTALFTTLVKDTDGRNAFKGLKLMAQMFDKEEKWLIKCQTHTEAGNVSLEGVVPDED
jgi:hypothetical protein